MGHATGAGGNFPGVRIIQHPGLAVAARDATQWRPWNAERY